jgi:hypothetical protein
LLSLVGDKLAAAQEEAAVAARCLVSVGQALTAAGDATGAADADPVAVAAARSGLVGLEAELATVRPDAVSARLSAFQSHMPAPSDVAGLRAAADELKTRLKMAADNILA